MVLENCLGLFSLKKNDIRTNKKINQSLKKWLRSYFNAQKRKLHFTFMLKKNGKNNVKRLIYIFMEQNLKILNFNKTTQKLSFFDKK